MAHKVKHKSLRPILSTRVRILGSIAITAISTTAFEYIFKRFFQKTSMELLNKLIDWCMLGIHVVGQISTACAILFVAILVGRWIYTNKTNNAYPYLLWFQLDMWLQDVGLCLQHGDGLVKIPRVRKYRNHSEFGIEIEILGDLRQKMLDMNATLNSYIAKTGSNWHVSESYEKNGYIRYTFSKGITSEQLGGNDLGL